MNKWDATFGSIAFLGGYLCSTYQAPWLLSLIIASGIGVTWALVSGLYDYVRLQRPRSGLGWRINRKPRWLRDIERADHAEQEAYDAFAKRQRTKR